MHSYRVDSLYSETYKIRGGLDRNIERDPEDDAQTGGLAILAIGEGVGTRNLEREACISRQTFSDLKFEFDPLFQKTTAKFDERGAQGLLQNISHTSGDQLEVIFYATHDIRPTAQVVQPEPDRHQTTVLTETATALADFIAQASVPEHISQDLSEFVARIQGEGEDSQQMERRVPAMVAEKMHDEDSERQEDPEDQMSAEEEKAIMKVPAPLGVEAKDLLGKGDANIMSQIFGGVANTGKLHEENKESDNADPEIVQPEVLIFRPEVELSVEQVRGPPLEFGKLTEPNNAEEKEDSAKLRMERHFALSEAR